MVLDRGRSGLRLGVIFLFACLLWLAPATSRAATEDGTAFSELTADDAKDIAVDRTTHLVTTFDQISTTGTWGKRWV